MNDRAVGPDRASPVYFGPPARRLFGWFHPALGQAPRDGAAVLCGPLGNESTGWHRGLRHWAEGLAAAGIAALRFDYHGMGDSAGLQDAPSRLDAWRGSVRDAVVFARAASGSHRIALIGVHAGSILALDAACGGDVEALVLWGSFPTGKAYLREARAFTRLMGAAGGAPIDGFEQLGGLALPAREIAQLEGFDPLACGKPVSASVLVVPRDDTSTDAGLIGRLTEAGASVERRALPGYDGMMIDAHQSSIPIELITQTVAWLCQRFQRATTDLRRPEPTAAGEPTLLLRADESASRAPASDVIERPIRFGDDDSLFGILSQPATGLRRRTGIVLANAGAVHRVGPNRLYVSLAREWAALGYSVFRMDIRGLGDSRSPSGADENVTYPDHAVDDVAAGMAELRARGIDRIAVAGLCSGAHTSFHAGLDLADVSGLLVVNPIVFYWKASDPLDVSSWVNYVHVRHYGQAMRSSDSWRRLLRGKVDIGHVLNVGATRVREIVRARAASISRRLSGNQTVGENVARDLRRIVSDGKDVLLLFSDGDPGLDYLMLNFGAEVRRLERVPGFRLRVLADADHTFTMLDARRRAQATLTEHLLARHP